MLPAAIWGEKEGTYTNSERRVSKVNRAVEPPGEARSDFDIFLDLARQLGVPRRALPGLDRAERCLRGMEARVRGPAVRLLGHDLRGDRGARRYSVAVPAGAARSGGSRDSTPTASFRPTTAARELMPTTWEPFPEQPNAEFPFVLNTGRTVEHWHTRTKTGQVPILERLSPRAWLEMNPRDARALRLKPHGPRRRRLAARPLRKLDLRLTETVGPGQVFVPFHWAEANANQATQSAFDPISREPNYKQCAVRVERRCDAMKKTRRGRQRHGGHGLRRADPEARPAVRDHGLR